MRSIPGKSLLLLQYLLQPRQQIVERVSQILNFVAGRGNRKKLARLIAAQCLGARGHLDHGTDGPPTDTATEKSAHAPYASGNAQQGPGQLPQRRCHRMPGKAHADSQSRTAIGAIGGQPNSTRPGIDSDLFVHRFRIETPCSEPPAEDAPSLQRTGSVRGGGVAVADASGSPIKLQI